MIGFLTGARISPGHVDMFQPNLGGSPPAPSGPLRSHGVSCDPGKTVYRLRDTFAGIKEHVVLAEIGPCLSGWIR